MVYPENFESKIGFDRIREMISSRCISPMGIKAASEIIFMTDMEKVNNELSKTSEFQQILMFEEPFPSENYFDISATLDKIRIEGTFPEIHEVYDLKRSLETLRSILNFFKSVKENSYPSLKEACSGIKIYPYLLDATDRILDRHGNIKDSASQRLREIRSDLASKGQSVSRKLASILKQAQNDGIVDTDANVSIRNGRGVIPVNVYDKRKIKGLVHDQSASGKTVFIEPAEIVELNNEIIELEYEERREIVRILTAFADDIRPYLDELRASNAFLGEIDFIRAKALMGNWLGSVKPVVSEKQVISWRKARHPLLFAAFSRSKERKVVPLDITLDENGRILLISGPNAGGKSVCLKTVGLLQYMFQCGLTVPVGEGSEFSIFRNIFIDIGDGIKQCTTFVLSLNQANKDRHYCFSRTYAAASTIASSITPMPKSASTIGCAASRTVLSLHFLKLERKKQVRDVIAPSMPFDLSRPTPRSTNTASKSFFDFA